MNRVALVRVAMLASGLLVAADMANAAPRGPATRKPAKVDDSVGDPAVWAKRLTGRFLLDGSINHAEYIQNFNKFSDAPLDSPYNQGTLDPWSQAVKGGADCMVFGTGIGLQCVLNVTWQEQWRNNQKDQLGGVPDLTPGVALAGVAPSTEPGKISILLVDKRGLAHPGAVTLHANRATAQLPCVNRPGMRECKQIFTITEKKNLVFVSLSTTVRSTRDKLERKAMLEHVKLDERLEIPEDEAPMERAAEEVEEQIVVSFTLRRVPQPN